MTTSKILQKRPIQRRVFTVEQANATLPLVRAIMTDLVQLSQEIIERRQRLSLLMGDVPSEKASGKASGKMSGGHSSSKTAKKKAERDDPYRDELIQIEKDVERDTRQLREYVDELRAIGAEPKGGPDGLVDFPSIIDGEKVFLCWKLDEPKVMYYHGLDDGFAGRQAIPASAFGKAEAGNNAQ